jgi:hypothetical protein
MIKNFTFIALTCFLIAFTSSCTKDSVGSSNSGGTSSFTFDGAPGSCATPAVAGIYSIDRPMDASNTLTFTVNVTVKGTYSIRTTSSNGVYFEAGGTFTTTGPQTIVFLGRGIPVKAGNFPYVPATNNTCNFSVSFLSGAPAAVFTYAGGTGTCTAPGINGTYGIGAPLGTGNYVDLAVNVTTPGAYTVSTNSANGISFSGSGTFTAGGGSGQVIRLIGNGTPTSSGSFAYTPSGGCSFTINVTTAGGTSIYTLDCSTAVVAGTYTAGSPLGAGNTITIKANVTSAGTYSISIPVINGMIFSTSGTFAVGSNQTIVLTGSGIPAAAGSNNITIGAGGCSVPVNTVAPPPALFNLTCNSTAVSGSYVVGTLLTTSNKVVVEVNVSSAGAYTITSNTMNGMTFSKTGVFSGTGIQNVTLTGNGTPVAAGTDNFTVGTAACPFSVTTTAPTSPCSGLMDGVFVMTGQFTINGFSFGASLGSQYQVSIQNAMGIRLDAFFPGSNPPLPGTYNIGTVSMSCLTLSPAAQWNATSGTVYVSNVAGQTIVEFCNVNFTGTILFPGGTVTSTGAGKMVL